MKVIYCYHLCTTSTFKWWAPVGLIHWGSLEWGAGRVAVHIYTSILSTASLTLELYELHIEVFFREVIIRGHLSHGVRYVSTKWQGDCVSAVVFCPTSTKPFVTALLREPHASPPCCVGWQQLWGQWPRQPCYARPPLTVESCYGGPIVHHQDNHVSNKAFFLRKPPHSALFPESKCLVTIGKPSFLALLPSVVLWIHQRDSPRFRKSGLCNC